MSNPVWPMLAGERAALVDYLTTLSDADWNRETPCAGWTVRDQLAHVVAGANTTPLTFGPSFIGAGFSFDRLGARGIRRQAAATPAELIAALGRLLASGLDGIVVNMIADGHDPEAVALAGQTLTKAMA